MKFQRWPEGWSILIRGRQINYGNKNREPWWPFDAKVIHLPGKRSIWW